jgi:hypothetical protein
LCPRLSGCSTTCVRSCATERVAQLCGAARAALVNALLQPADVHRVRSAAAQQRSRCPPESTTAQRPRVPYGTAWLHQATVTRQPTSLSPTRTRLARHATPARLSPRHDMPARRWWCWHTMGPGWRECSPSHPAPPPPHTHAHTTLHKRTHTRHPPPARHTSWAHTHTRARYATRGIVHTAAAAGVHTRRRIIQCCTRHTAAVRTPAPRTATAAARYPTSTTSALLSQPHRRRRPAV